MGKKIKIKDLECDSEALDNLLKMSNVSIADYLNIYKNPQIDIIILLIIIAISVIIVSALWIIPYEHVNIRKVLILLSILFLGCCVVCVHLIWRSRMVTAISFLIVFCLFLVSIDAITPADAANRIMEKIISKS